MPRPVLEGPPSARSEEHSPAARTVDGSRQRARGLSWAGRVDGNDLPRPGGGQRPDSAVPLPTTGAARRGLGAWVTEPTPRSQGLLGPRHPLPEAELLPTGPRQPGDLCLQPPGTLAGWPSGGPNTHLGWSKWEFEDMRGPRQEKRRRRALRTASRVHSKTQTKPAAFCWGGGLLFVLGFFLFPFLAYSQEKMLAVLHIPEAPPGAGRGGCCGPVDLSPSPQARVPAITEGPAPGAGPAGPSRRTRSHGSSWR